MADLAKVKRLLVYIALLAAQVCSASSAAEPAVASARPLPIPGGFRLAGSNGYTLYVLAAPARGGRPGRVLVYASAKDKGASYKAPATVTENSIQANLGSLGEISVDFHRSNQAHAVSCGKQTVRFDSGHFEGKIVFRGEEGFTTVEATTAPGLVTGFCGEGFFSGGPGRYRGGAELYVRNPALGPGMSVRKSQRNGVAEIEGWTSEYVDGILIGRFASLQMPSADFTYDSQLRQATVRPPAPFFGSARFDRGKKAGLRWSGDLTVDLPGRSAVPLTGPTLRANLVPSG